MILNRQKLVTILGVLGSAVGNKILRVADYVHFRLDKESRKLFISTTDFDAYITMDYGDLGITTLDDVPEIFMLEYRMLASIIKTSTTEDVEFKEPKIGGAMIVTTNGKYDLQRHGDVTEFPSVNYSHKVIGTFAVPVFQSMWGKAAVAVSKDVTKINYQGVNYDGNFVATDNKRVSIALGEKSYDGEPMLLMPNIGNITKHCKNSLTLGLSESGKQMIVDCPEIGMVASVRLIDAKFPAYKMFASSKTDDFVVSVDKQELLGVISRLANFTDQIFKVVKVKIAKDGEGLRVHFTVSNKGEGSESIFAKSFQISDELKDSDTSVLCDEMYHIENLLDGVSVTESNELVTFSIQPNGMLWIEEKNFLYLLTKIQN